MSCVCQVYTRVHLSHLFPHSRNRNFLGFWECFSLLSTWTLLLLLPVYLSSVVGATTLWTELQLGQPSCYSGGAALCWGWCYFWEENIYLWAFQRLLDLAEVVARTFWDTALAWQISPHRFAPLYHLAQHLPLVVVQCVHVQVQSRVLPLYHFTSLGSIQVWTHLLILYIL